MPVRIDHVIAAASDLDALERAYTRLGFFVTGGGTHPHLGTRNRIIMLGESYIELLALDMPEHASQALRQRLERGPGWIGFAVQADDIESDVAAMRGRSVHAVGPNPGRLVAPSGQARSWRVVTVGTEDLWQSAEPLPFLIQHDATGEQHRQELAGESGLAPHKNGVMQLTDAVVAVRDVEAAAQRYALTYDLHPVTTAAFDTSLVARTLDLLLDGGSQRIRLAQPEATGIVADRLAEAGEGLCLVSVAVGDLQQTEMFLREQGVQTTATESGLFVPAATAGGAAIRFARAYDTQALTYTVLGGVMKDAAARVAEALEQAGVETEVREFAESTRTSQDAANAIGTTLGRIVKSLVFLSGDQPILALVSGENRVDTQRLGVITGGAIKRASADEARAATGFSIGDVPPVGHLTKLATYLDQDLLQYDEVWAAAGTTNTVFRIVPADLQRITDAAVVDLAAR